MAAEGDPVRCPHQAQKYLDHDRIEGSVIVSASIKHGLSGALRPSLMTDDDADMQMVSLTLRVMSRPDFQHLPKIYQGLGLEWVWGP